MLAGAAAAGIVHARDKASPQEPLNFCVIHFLKERISYPSFFVGEIQALCKIAHLYLMQP